MDSDIGPNNIDVFNTPGKLTVEYCKNDCDPKWTDGSTAENLQLCIKFNMMCLFIKNSAHQNFLKNIKEERLHWTRPGGGDGITLLIAICSKNAHGERVSTVVAKTELLSMKTKDFQHNV